MQDQCSSPDQGAPADGQLQDEPTKRLMEATERTNFHRGEAERWERIGRAVGIALNEIEAVSPVSSVTPDSLRGRDQMPDHYAVQNTAVLR